MPVQPLAVGSATPAILSAQSGNHCTEPHVPISATEDSAVAIRVVFKSLGPKISCNGLIFVGLAFTAACHFSDSGIKRRTMKVSKAGAAPINATQRQESIVTLKKIAMTAINAKPTFAAAPIMPAIRGRCFSGQISMTKAMPSDHSPPMPRAATKREAHKCQGSRAK